MRLNVLQHLTGENFHNVVVFLPCFKFFYYDIFNTNWKLRNTDRPEIIIIHDTLESISCFLAILCHRLKVNFWHFSKLHFYGFSTSEDFRKNIIAICDRMNAFYSTCINQPSSNKFRYISPNHSLWVFYLTLPSLDSPPLQMYRL